MENLKSWFGWFPYRCRDCEYRFMARALEHSAASAGVKDWRPDQHKRRRRRTMRVVVLIVVVLAIFLMFLYYLVQPGTYGSE